MTRTMNDVDSLAVQPITYVERDDFGWVDAALATQGYTLGKATFASVLTVNDGVKELGVNAGADTPGSVRSSVVMLLDEDCTTAHEQRIRFQDADTNSAGIFIGYMDVASAAGYSALPAASAVPDATFRGFGWLRTSGQPNWMILAGNGTAAGLQVFDTEIACGGNAWHTLEVRTKPEYGDHLVSFRIATNGLDGYEDVQPTRPIESYIQQFKLPHFNDPLVWGIQLRPLTGNAEALQIDHRALGKPRSL